MILSVVEIFIEEDAGTFPAGKKKKFDDLVVFSRIQPCSRGVLMPEPWRFRLAFYLSTLRYLQSLSTLDHGFVKGFEPVFMMQE